MISVVLTSVDQSVIDSNPLKHVEIRRNPDQITSFHFIRSLHRRFNKIPNKRPMPIKESLSSIALVESIIDFDPPKHVEIRLNSYHITSHSHFTRSLHRSFKVIRGKRLLPITKYFPTFLCPKVVDGGR
jgi:hypothetical protein